MKTFDGKYQKQFNYISERYEFRFNVVTSFYEYREIKTKKWFKYDDRTKNSILLELMEEDLDISQDKFNIFIESEEVSPDFNPFEEYFDNLEKWDEKTNYIEQISKTVETDNTKHFNSTLERFLVGCIDCLLDTDAVNDVCLVFQSGQGIGKTRWMRALLPKEFQSEYLYEGNIDTKNKDHTMYLSQYWFIHLDELETLRSNDISAIKSFITRQRISVRKAYGRYKSNFVRRASFLGSVNEDKFLSDITGNRRWLIFKVKTINYLHEVNPDKVWAQAYHLWKNGYRHWFDIDEIKKINQYNEEFRTISLEEELFLRNFQCNDIDGFGEYLSSTEVIIKIAENVPQLVTKMHAILMGKALSKHSKVKKMTGGYQKYFVEYIGVAPTIMPQINNHQQTAPNSAVNKIDDDDDDLPF